MDGNGRDKTWNNNLKKNQKENQIKKKKRKGKKTLRAKAGAHTRSH
jgi:hypothetical protein